jgi:hypothetical protein
MRGDALSAEQSTICTDITYSMGQPTGNCQNNMDVGAISADTITIYQPKESISIKALMMV